MSNYPELAKYFEENYPKLVKKVKRRAGTPENAEDVVQEAFYRACKYWSSYDPKQDLKTWFGVILNNACKDKVREDKMLGMTVEVDETELEPVVMPKHDCGTLKRIDELARSKAAHQQEILHLYYKLGYSLSEINQIVDADYKNIDTIIQRFKEEVKEKLGA